MRHLPCFVGLLPFSAFVVVASSRAQYTGYGRRPGKQVDGCMVGCGAPLAQARSGGGVMEFCGIACQPAGQNPAFSRLHIQQKKLGVHKCKCQFHCNCDVVPSQDGCARGNSFRAECRGRGGGEARVGIRSRSCMTNGLCLLASGKAVVAALA
ncbi:hypothetical protein QBC42DRAFT_255191 [Cladorrhinum samala]|uniref:Uncharacterized protein n=1 Tax=Cladorrhinum samala TaxID=585594 RepID=A0AAV9HDH4_9PEZI|nr:hypothetical protein QBC42DRAFT_255191 [Cladorrhinum samala]